MFDISGKKAIITGANRGMGFSIAKGIHDAGGKVVLIDISEDVTNAAAKIDPSGESAFGVVGDLSKLDKLEEIFSESIGKLDGQVDILVNAAGISRRGDCETFDPKDWADVMNINSNAVFFLSQLAGREMIKNGGGKIINVASMLSFFGSGGSIAYATSKGAVAQITKSLAIAWGIKGVNVNAIAPGWIKTELTQGVRKNTEKTEIISSRIPMKKWGEPEDVVGTVVFLSSDASSYINGAIIPVDGGYLAY